MPDITLDIVQSAPIELNFGYGAVGVPPGGIAGQVLSKINSTDYNTEWATPGAASLANTFTAGENLSTGRIVVIDAGQAFYFQPTNPAHAGRVYGITKSSASLGGSVTVQFTGDTSDPAFSFTADSGLYAIADGVITATKPSSGTIQYIGTAISATRIRLEIWPTIQ